MVHNVHSVNIYETIAQFPDSSQLKNSIALSELEFCLFAPALPQTTETIISTFRMKNFFPKMDIYVLELQKSTW